MPKTHSRLKIWSSAQNYQKTTALLSTSYNVGCWSKEKNVIENSYDYDVGLIFIPNFLIVLNISVTLSESLKGSFTWRKVQCWQKAHHQHGTEKPPPPCSTTSLWVAIRPCKTKRSQEFLVSNDYSWNIQYNLYWLRLMELKLLQWSCGRLRMDENLLAVLITWVTLSSLM